MIEATQDTPSAIEKKYITIAPKKFHWDKPKPEIESKRPVSNPLLHDFIVSILHHKAKTIYPLLRNIPQTSGSKIFKDDTWHYHKSLQEYIINRGSWKHMEDMKSAKADAVWIFNKELWNEYPDGKTLCEIRYAVINEVKTGSFSLNSVFEHYSHKRASSFSKENIDHCTSHIRLFIWAWKKFIEDDQQNKDTYNEQLKIEIRKGNVKTIELEHILPVIKENLFKLANDIEGEKHV